MKVVEHTMNDVQGSLGNKNTHSDSCSFINFDGSIVSSYPGELVLVSIQVEDTIFYQLSICGIHFFVHFAITHLIPLL
jgi:hypothetical protein